MGSQIVQNRRSWHHILIWNYASQAACQQTCMGDTWICFVCACMWYICFCLHYELTKQQELNQPINLLETQVCTMNSWHMRGVCWLLREPLVFTITPYIGAHIGLCVSLEKHNPSFSWIANFHNIVTDYCQHISGWLACYQFACQLQ